jgi:hypothetical protein
MGGRINAKNEIRRDVDVIRGYLARIKTPSVHESIQT